MKSDRHSPVAIIGAGFSGTMVAAQLARRGIGSLLVEANGREGRGTAYSTGEPTHLLNVRAEGMSAWAYDPDHFARRFEAAGGDRRGFAERRLFGDYLRAILDEAVASGRVALAAEAAVGAAKSQSRWMVELASGERVACDALVLAQGNQPPEPLPFAEEAGERLVNSPWGAEAKRAVAAVAESGGDALIVGTGLTMVDMVLSLDAAGHHGRLVAVSRRGLIPRSHADFDPAPVERSALPEADVLALWRWLRLRSAQVGFRAAVDSLRPHSQAIWQGFDPEQQRRFLRHARPWWDVHRHRIAPQVSSRLRELVETGQLEIVAGRIASVERGADGIEVAIRRRGRIDAAAPARFRTIFNCTGPLGVIGRTRDRLLRALLDSGAARADCLGIGLDVDHRSRVVGSSALWALGPLTKGRYWEIVAVPDIRVQAAEVAEDIARELQQ